MDRRTLATEEADKLLSSQRMNRQDPGSRWDTDNRQEPSNQPCVVLYKHRRRPDHGCMYHFNMEKCAATQAGVFSRAAATPLLSLGICLGKVVTFSDEIFFEMRPRTPQGEDALEGRKQPPCLANNPNSWDPFIEWMMKVWVTMKTSDCSFVCSLRHRRWRRSIVLHIPRLSSLD